MPNRNRRGPLGEGAMTGKGQGNCNQTQNLYGCEFGKMNNRKGSFQNSDDTIDELKSEAANLKLLLESINRKIAEFENR